MKRAMGSPPRGGPYDVHKISEKRGTKFQDSRGTVRFRCPQEEVNFLGELV